MIMLKKILRLVAIGMAGWLDFTAGAAIVLLIEAIAGVAHHWAYCLVGSTFALAPDLDVFYILARYKKFSGQHNHHDYFTHRPTLVLPTIVVTWLLFGFVWAVIIGSCLLWHYLHDDHGLGYGGIAWAWPLSSRYRSILPWVASITPEESIMVEEQEKWLEDAILSPSRFSVPEMILSSVLVVVVVTTLDSLWLGAVLFGLQWATAGSIWRLHRWQQAQEK